MSTAGHEQVGAALDPDAAVDLAEHLFDKGWSDGLPILPATEERVQHFLAHTDRDASHVIARFPQLDRAVSARDIAVHAIMAGCRPDYLPVVLSAWEALAHERAALGGGWQSTSGPAPMVIVNGAVRHAVEMNAQGGVLGPGFRANATIPRAIGLTVRNGFGVVPHALEQATQGVPGRWNICLAESEEDSPWEPLAVEAGFARGESAVSTIFIRSCEVVDNRHYSVAEDVLRDFADTMRRTGPWIFRNVSAGIVLNPEHAHLLADAGYSRSDVRQWLYEHCTRTEAELRAVGKSFLDPDGREYREDHVHHMFPSAAPSSIPLVVAGSRNAAISMVFRLFSTWSGRPVRVH